MVFYKVAPTIAGDFEFVAGIGHLLFGFVFLSLKFISGFGNLTHCHVAHPLKVPLCILDVDVYLFQLLTDCSLTLHFLS